jgi:hypothetical protein
MARSDAQRGLQASLRTPPAQVAEACARVINDIPKVAFEPNSSGGRASLHSKSKVLWNAAVGIREADGRTNVSVRLENFKFMKGARLLFVIPLSPDILIGKAEYKTLLENLGEALKQLDGSATVEMTT